MSLYETLVMERDGAVGILTINRPEKRNALSTQVRNELVAALDALRDDGSVRVLVVTGAGDKAFVAGADIAVDHEGRLHRFHATFRQHCEAGSTYLDGEVAVLLRPLR